MQETIEGYIRSRARVLGLSIAEVCRRAGLSRQTLYALGQIPDRFPNLQTLVSLSEVLQVHPLRLLNIIFANVQLPSSVVRQHIAQDKSAFIQDLTIPDGSLVVANQRFIKSWELQNVGTQAWEDRYLQCMDEEVVVYSRTGEELQIAHNLVPSSRRIAIPYTRPGEIVRLSVEFTAPQEPCTALSYWKSFFADGSLCFPDDIGVWVKVRVSTVTACAETPRPASAGKKLMEKRLQA